MHDNRAGGWLLIVGSAMGILVMGFHPSGGGGKLPSPDALAHLVFFNRAVHSVAIATLPALFLGALALTNAWRGANRFPVAALIIYGFALLALMCAGAMDGFVASDILARMVAGDPKLESRYMLLDYTFRINQAFASIFVVASCAAIFLWSWPLAKAGRGFRALGIYGLIIAPLVALALCSGYLPPHVHQFGIVIALQAIWFISAGVLLMRMEPAVTPSAR